MNPSTHRSLAELGAHLAELAEGLAGAAEDIEAIGRQEGRSFEREARLELDDLINEIEGGDHVG